MAYCNIENQHIRSVVLLLRAPAGGRAPRALSHFRRVLYVQMFPCLNITLTALNGEVQGWQVKLHATRIRYITKGMERRLALFMLTFGVVVAGTILWRNGAYQGAVAGLGAMIGIAGNQEMFIDVRTDEEWNAGHVDGALHFDLNRLRVGELPDLTKNTQIALYCRTGIRAGEALQILQENGFTKSRNAGGLADLQAQGKKICTGPLSTCD